MQWQYWKDSACPRCESVNVDSNHVIKKCGRPEAAELCGDLILKVSRAMEKYGTLEPLRMTIVLVLFDNKGGTFVSNVPKYDESNPIKRFTMRDCVRRRHYWLSIAILCHVNAERA